MTGGAQPPSVNPCRLCSNALLNSELPPALLVLFALMTPLKIVTAAEGEDEDDDDDPDTERDDVEPDEAP